MRCHDVSRRMGMFLDSELSPETNLEMVEHLEQCASCAARIERERQLEASVRDRLLLAAPQDEAACKRALGEATRVGAGVGVWRRMRTALVVAAALGAITVGAFLPRVHREMDLARSTNSDHTRFLEEVREEELPPATLDHLRQIAASTLHGATPIPEATPGAFHLLKVGRCTLDGAPVAYLILGSTSEPVSLFLMDRAELSRFPDAAARFAQEPAGVTCRVGDRTFVLSGSPSVVACGIGRTEPRVLRDLLHWLLPS